MLRVTVVSLSKTIYPLLSNGSNKAHLGLHCLKGFYDISADNKSRWLVIGSLKVKLAEIALDTVLPAKSDSDVMFCLQSYQGRIIDRPIVY